MKFHHSLFNEPKNANDIRLSKVISIKTPKMFQDSINLLKQGGLTIQEFKALKVAQERAKMLGKRKDISNQEQWEFNIIANMKLN